MSKKVLILTAIILAFAASNLQAEQISVSWDSGGDGRSWGDPCNWNPDIVPDNNETNTFAVTIDAGAGQLELHLHSSRTIDRLDCYGEFRWYMGVFQSIAGASMAIDLTLNEPNGLTNYGDLVLFIYGAQFSRIVGNITNHALMELQSDVGYIKGNVTNVSGAELYLDEIGIMGNLYNLTGAELEIGNEVGLRGNLENDGLFVIDIDGEFCADRYINNTGEIQLYGGECASDEIFDNNSAGSIRGFGTVFGDDLFANQGKVCASGGSLFLYSDGVLTNTSTGTLSADPASTLHVRAAEDINNLGKLEIMAGAVTFGCNLVNESGAEIKLMGGTLAATTIKQSPDANFAGFGTITSDVLIDPNGIIKLTGPTNVIGDVNISANATLEISDGTTLVTGQTTCNNGTIHMIGGRIICQGGLTNNNCNIIWEPGIYTNIADFNLDGTVNFKDFADFANTWLWQASWY